jgi:signal transduction histidine kinase
MADSSLRINDLLLAFIPTLPARIWVKNSEGAYLYVNERMIDDFGIPREQWLGSTDERFFPQLARAYRRNDQAVLASAKPLQTTDLVIRRGQTEYAFVLRFPLEVDRELGLGALAIDLTNEISGLVELQRVQEQRYQNERLRALGELASGLAHDLSNNLNAARLRLDIVRHKADPTLTQDIDAVIRSMGAAAERVKGVQNFVRDGREGELKVIDLTSLIREAIDMVDVVMKPPTLLGGRTRVECALPESMPGVSGLSTEVKHVFANLFLNARDAMPEGGTVTVAARIGDTVDIIISDEGPGIAKENLTKIFNPFFTTKQTGSGLGLSMAKDVMTRIGGDIIVCNREEGGAAFTLRFPIAQS